LAFEIGKSPRTLDTSAVLWDMKGKFCFPLGKVLKYLKNGTEDSVRFFAQVIISESPDSPNTAPSPPPTAP
jgi:hypothetical protein